MGELTQEQRLALAVTAGVARMRADRARERADLAARRTGPVFEAVDRFEERHGRPPAEGELAAVPGPAYSTRSMWVPPRLTR